jgi:pimeloyl-ACP methyl ester carboxylesterase
MEARRLSEAATTDVVVIPGACSSGIAWSRVPGIEQARILSIPDVPTVSGMADRLRPALEDRSRPRILVAASLGAMVAMELMHSVRVDVFVAVAAGFGIAVSERVLQRVRNDTSDVLSSIARASLMGEDLELRDLAVADLRSRGRHVMIRHLTALSEYRPRVPSTSADTFVVWGRGDRSVSLDDHLELVRRLDGLLVPVDHAGHLPFLENAKRFGQILDSVRPGGYRNLGDCV